MKKIIIIVACLFLLTGCTVSHYYEDLYTPRCQQAFGKDYGYVDGGEWRGIDVVCGNGTGELKIIPRADS